MHIKHIHCMIEKLAECAKCEIENKGIEQVNTKEMGEAVDILKDLCEAEYYAKISKAMDESEYGEDYDWKGAYDEHNRKGYRGQPRDSRGRYMSRRGYEQPMMYDWDNMEYQRDMDRNMGRMGYAQSGSSMGAMSSGNRGYSDGRQSEGGQYSSRSQDGGRDSREGRSGQSRRGYMEAKEKGMDKQQKMKELEEYMKTMAEDLTEAIEGASPEERAMAKNKLSVLVQKM